MDYVTSETENTVARNPLDVIKIGLLEKEVADLRGIIERLEERIEGPAAESQEKKPGKVVRIFVSQALFMHYFHIYKQSHDRVGLHLIFWKAIEMTKSRHFVPNIY